MGLIKKYSKTKNSCKVTFELPKEAIKGAKKVTLLGEFNNWNKAQGIELKSVKNGSFKAEVELPTGKDYQFRYLINDSVWENDWNADQYVATPFGVNNSVVFVPEVSDVPVKQSTVKAKVNKKAIKPTAKKVSAKVAKKATTKLVKKASPKVVKTIMKDKLTKIEGIGPAIEKVFNKAGITTFASLSTMKVKELKTILADAGNRFKMHEPKTWPKQAKLAAKGNWDKLAKLQDELKGGK